jgi:hypothetical protein
VDEVSNLRNEVLQIGISDFMVSSTRILVNGVPGAPVHTRQGLRQGDPLSPMLFILMMGPLQHLFSLAASLGAGAEPEILAIGFAH